VSSFPRMSTSINLAGVPSSRATFGSPSTAPLPVCVSATLGMLTVWIPHQKKKSQLKTIGGGLPPSERSGKTYDWRAATPTLFVCMLIATCTMARQDLTPGLAPSQHPCMQPHFTPTSSPPTPLHLVVISTLVINSPFRARYWASPRQPLRIE